MENTLTTTRKLNFYGKGGDLFGIMIANTFLTLFTLGLYYPWARVKMLKYMYQSTELNESRFAFHGTGPEIFKGFIKAYGLIILIYGLFYGMLYAGMPIVAIIFFFVAIMLFTPIAIHGSLKYRMSRSSLKGIYFSYNGTLPDMIKVVFSGFFLTMITFGLYSAWFRVSLMKQMFNNIKYGNVSLKFTGDGADLFTTFIKGYFLTIFTLGIYFFRFMAQMQNFVISHLELEQGEKRGVFYSTLNGWDFFKLLFVNGLIITFTLGLGYPWVIARSISLIYSKIELVDDLDWDSIEQEASGTASATGDILTEGLDLQII